MLFPRLVDQMILSYTDATEVVYGRTVRRLSGSVVYETDEE